MSFLENANTDYGDPEFSAFLRKAFSRHLGHDPRDLDRPIIGICNTFSEINRCHTHFGPLVDAVKRGVLLAGGIPLEFPTISLGEMFTNPTTMLFRNLAAMDTEEMIRAQPIDGVVLMAGCDKTTPAQLMGAASADVPAILLTGGPMINGEHRGRTLGACSDCRYYWQEYRAGQVSDDELEEINASLAPSAGHCMVMGSASTMAACSEAMGMSLPGCAAFPALDNRRLRLAEETGRQIVECVRQDLRPSKIITEKALHNAVRVLMAVGGSTNAIIHLIAIAGRLGLELPLSTFDRIGTATPVLANVRPAGRFQMQEFAHAGGVPALMKRLGPILDLDALTVTGKTIGDALGDIEIDPVYDEVIRPLERPLFDTGGLAILQGNLAPDGAVIKTKSASPHLLRHTGRAVVFESLAHLHAAVDDPDLPIEAGDVMVLQNAGPVGGPGMPEAGLLPIPKKLLAQGVRDIVRISDCRMSGTASGTIVLHAAPEAAVGGPIGLVRTGDLIELDVDARRIELLVSPEELEGRRRQWKSPPRAFTRGYGMLHQEHVMQANRGCDFDFLTSTGDSEPRSTQ